MIQKRPMLEVVYRLIGDLVADPKNARLHSKKQISQIASSIDQYGFVNPVLVDDAMQLIAGHGRLEAARLLKLASVPTIQLIHLTTQQKRALALADNKIADNASWDEQLLAQALQEIITDDIDFDFGAIGFESAEIDLLLEAKQKDDPADEVVEPDPDVPPVTKPGDLWLLGDHRLLCGSALDLDDYEKLMDGDSAQMVITDAPFNVKIDGHVSGHGHVKHGEFAMASGEMSPDEFTSFLSRSFKNIARYSTAGAVVMAFMDWRHMGEMLNAGGQAFTELLNLCIWNKSNGGMGSMYRSKHELVFIFQSGKGRHINNIELGKHGRHRTNVWDYAGANVFRRGRDEDLADHPTVKPVLMIADAIKDCSRRGGIILDPFGGSGTTLLAAERTGRRARLIELDPKYVDVALKRWTKLYPDRPPVLADTEEPREVVAARGVLEAGCFPRVARQPSRRRQN